MKGMGDIIYVDGEPVDTGTSSSGSYYNPTQQFGTFDSQGNLIPYDPWGRVSSAPITTPPFFGGGTFGSGSTPGGTNFWSALTQGLTNATSILGARYAVPQLNPGQVIQTGPGGTSFMSQAQAGGALTTSSSLLGGGLGSGTLLLLIGGIALFVMMGKK